MPFEVMNAEDGLAKRSAQRASDARTHEQRTCKAGAARIGDHVDIRQGLAGFVENGSRQLQYATDVIAAREFGHHAAIGLMHGDLAVQRVRQQHGQFVLRGSGGRLGAARFDQGHARFVAG